MFRPSRASLSAFRPTAPRTPPRVSSKTPSRRRMVSAASLPFDEAQAPSSLNFPILDIFDAPSRLGESSKLLVLNAAISSTSSRARSLNTHAAAALRPAVKPLPSPIVFEGPARPRDMPFVTFRAFRARGASRSGTSSTPLPAPLPPPIMFEGPSQLRPYIRNGGWWGSNSSASSFAMSATSLMLAGAVVVILFGVDLEPSRDLSQTAKRQPSMV